MASIRRSGHRAPVSTELSRRATSALPLVQATLGATVAWAIALRVAGHPDPFFAPVSAVVALNAPQGERGLQAIRLLSGVVLGIVIGEAAVTGLGSNFVAIALGSLIAMVIAHMLGGTRIVVIQAGSGAILTIAAAGGEPGFYRLIDATIGGGVALVFSQILFTPEPVALLRGAATDALRGIADGLGRTAAALESGNAEEAEMALGDLRAVRDQLGELARLRQVSGHIARSSVIWRSQMAPLVRERENADHLDLLGGTCVMLARTVAVPGLTEREKLADGVRELSSILASLAESPGDRRTRQAATDRALLVARPLATISAPAGSSTAVAASMLRQAATDIMVFSGADAAQAVAAVREVTRTLRVPAPPATPSAPFGLDRWTPRRLGKIAGKRRRRPGKRSTVKRLRRLARRSTGKFPNWPPDRPDGETEK